jgi:VIT1/CCC1 family predicted Fe2+/Mn2+ transporter
MSMIDEERLHFVGSIVLGLNDALVELTGTIGGFTFALANNRLVASPASYGVAARCPWRPPISGPARGEQRRAEVQVYTGIAYLLTVIATVLRICCCESCICSRLSS